MPVHHDAAVQNVMRGLSVYPCPGGCGVLVGRNRRGHAEMCRPCTEREIGMSVIENGARISAGLSVAAMLRRPADAPLPLARVSAVRRRLHA